MRISAISGSVNFKSRSSCRVGYGVPQGADYSAVKASGLDEKDKARIQKQIKNGENVASAKKDLAVSGIPRTLDYVRTYCPECAGFDNSDDLTQEALLAVTESAQAKKLRTVSGFESKAERLSKRRLNEAVQSQTQISKNSCYLDEIADMTVSIEDCQRRHNDKRSQAFYNFIENALAPEEAAVIEGRHFCSKDQRRSYNDLSKELGLPINQVRKVEGRALKKLREPRNAQALLEMVQDDSLNM